MYVVFRMEAKLFYPWMLYFGLPRKKSAGVSHRDPLLKDVFFYDQLEVDRFVSENECGKGNQMVSMLFLTCCLYYS